MVIKIHKKNLIFTICFYIGLFYILMRPFLINYVSPLCKYIFMLLVAIAGVLTLINKKYLGKIGCIELFWIIVSYVYILGNAILLNGKELFSMALTAYIFYSFPILIMPLLMNRVNWRKVMGVVSAFGVLDAGISILEFINRRQMFPMSGVEGEVGTITKAGAYIVRTYGLQGSYFILAEVLCFCGFCAFYLYRSGKSKINLVAWIIISVGILTTGSRGYYVSYAAGMAAILYCEHYFDKNRGINKKTLITIMSVIILLIFFIYLILGTNITTGNADVDVVLNRIRMIFDWEGDSANVQRMSIWMWSIDHWKEAFLFGHGACSTDIRFSGYIKVTESGVLKRLCELGVVGTIIQYITMFIPIKSGVKKLFNKKLDSNSLPFIATMIAYFIEDFVLERYTAPEYTVLLWTSIAYIAYYQRGDTCYNNRIQC
ncbi:MAG TPA: O-antigen ligase family protein [Candidatus Fimimorpha faecalis]|uniref:O-antigen ligase family protein n=1 Tax=Candidatus Fimimorpha faecalis TaxID=2840824 RepID=A0A9D1EFK8_9FIRM|nr:O-antigen ligase family protein [Candidatus Fimimorpha faecalis]